MVEIGTKIKNLRLKKGLSQDEVADKLKTTKQTIYKYENGIITNIPTSKIEASAELFDTTPAYLMGWTENTNNNISNLSIVNKVKKVPLLGKIACGEPILAQENWEETILLPDNVSADFALRCKDDSMIDARIYNGDIVYIKSQSQADNGSIVAVLIDNEATLKRFYRPNDNTVILQPENKNYQPMIFVGDEINNLHIIGKATYFLSEVN